MFVDVNFSPPNTHLHLAVYVKARLFLHAQLRLSVYEEMLISLTTIRSLMFIPLHSSLRAHYSTFDRDTNVLVMKLWNMHKNACYSFVSKIERKYRLHVFEEAEFRYMDAAEAEAALCVFVLYHR